jgi:hypothetical protein
MLDAILRDKQLTELFQNLTKSNNNYARKEKILDPCYLSVCKCFEQIPILDISQQDVLFFFDGRRVSYDLCSVNCISEILDDLNEKKISLKVVGADRYIALVKNLKRRLELFYGVCVSMNLYYSPLGSRALGKHKDFYDVFVFQILGAKKWYVEDDIFELVEEDLLMLKRGVSHYAEALSHSLHLTIGLDINSINKQSSYNQFMGIMANSAEILQIKSDFSLHGCYRLAVTTLVSVLDDDEFVIFKTLEREVRLNRARASVLRNYLLNSELLRIDEAARLAEESLVIIVRIFRHLYRNGIILRCESYL